MKSSIILSGILVFMFQLSYGKKENKYPISSISDDLKSNAKAVVRYEEHNFEILSDTKAKETITYAITILNENGYSLARFSEFYNSFIKVHNIEATVYGASGEKLHRIKQDDIFDLGMTNSISIYDDNRLKTFDPKTKDYPFTIEYSFVRSYNGIFSFPTWHLFKDYNVSVEKAIFRAKTSDPEAIRFNQRNINVSIKESSEDDLTVFSWEFNNYKARKKEPFSQHIIEYTPVIQLAPKKISIKGNKGSCDTWDSYGKFIAELNKDKDDLSEETILSLKELTKEAKSNLEKVQLVYEYMQNKTRYISIQVGMGGWQPFEASSVDRLGYGDCKALSNYMKSMLKGIGIQSIYTLVNAGNKALKLSPNFPSNQFNHAILCVPLQKDTLWLECTSQQNPCGFLSDFTDDRDVLLIFDEGGKIAHTRAYQSNDNIQERKITVNLDNSGNATANSTTTYSGISYKKLSPIFRMDKIDQKQFLINRIEIPNFILTSYLHDNINSQVPSIIERLNLKLPTYTSVLGNRLIVPLNLMNKQIVIPPHIRNRESEVLIRRPIFETDQIDYIIPEDYSIDKLPDSIIIKSQFGHYEAQTQINKNKVSYFRTFSLYKGKYPPDTYPELKEFFEKISNADQVKCLLKQN